MIDARVVAEIVRPHLGGSQELTLIQQIGDHAVFDTGNAIVKCGHRDDLLAEAWACDHALANGVPTSRVIAVDVDHEIPCLVVERVDGVPLFDARLSDELAVKAAREAGALLHQLHDLVLPGFGWAMGSQIPKEGVIRGKSDSWSQEVATELEWGLGYLVEHHAIDEGLATTVRSGLIAAQPLLEAVRDGRFLHGDIGRMHIFAHPSDGKVTAFIDWGDVQIGDPVWELAVARCHFTSASEGHLGYTGHPGLFPHLVDGYEPDDAMASTMERLFPLYLAYRNAWVARMCHEIRASVPEHLLENLSAHAAELIV